MCAQSESRKDKSMINKSKCPQKFVNINAMVGDWSGILDIGIIQMTIVLHIKVASSGSLSGTYDNLQEKIYGHEIDLLELDNELFKLEIKKYLVKFEGNLNNDKSVVSGQWNQYGKLFSLRFERGIKSIEAPKRPQEPKQPYPYKEELVFYDNKDANVTLSGTFTFPLSKGPFPVVILIAGAGPSDRDAPILGHKPFWVLADYLTRQGIAVLRFDKRGCGKSTGNFNTATTKDFAADVVSGIEYLQSRKEINFKQLGLIGHSEGGMIAPMVALQSQNVAYIILMAASGLIGEVIMYGWGESIERSKGSTTEAIEKEHQHKKNMFTVLKNEPNIEAAAKQLREILLKHTTLKEKKHELTRSEYAAIEAEVNYLNTPWFRYFLSYDPAVALKKVQIPVLVLHGELDQQIISKQNLPIISKALEEGGNKNYQSIELPQQNHLFQSCQNGSFEEYAKIEETVSPLALTLISEWILARTFKKESHVDE